MRNIGWRAVLLAVVVIGAGLLAGCRTYITIERYVPGRVSIGAADTLVLLQAKGRKSMRRELVESLREGVRASNYFGFKDRRDLGAEVVPAGDRVRVRGGGAPAEGQLGLSDTVDRWIPTRVE